jgi:osmotically-inducible protein OsmY
MHYRDEYDRERRYRGEGYYDRRRGGDDRGFLERAGDEVRSWFGDEEAHRRRMRDERDEPRGWGGPSRAWSPRDEDDIDSRAPGSQWHYRDLGYREPQWSSPPQRYAGPSWTHEGGYGREGWGDPSAWGPERSRSRSGDTFAGPHAGRGPRGYTRSDERIREDVCDRLCEHGFVDASDIEVRVASGEVTLLGSVRSRQEKRIAEDITEQVTGVRQLHNELRVNEGGQEAGGQAGRPFRAA